MIWDFNYPRISRVMGRVTDTRHWYCCIQLECFQIPFFYGAIQVITLQILMSSDDKLEAFVTIYSWCFMFILIIISYDFILFNRILSVLNELYVFERFLHLHIQFFVIDSMITLITGTIFRSNFKGLFLHFKHDCRVIMHLSQLWVS